MPDQIDDQDEIQQDAEDTTSALNGGMVIIELEASVKNHVSAIDRLTEELKKHREMLDDIFANDPTYQEHLEAAKQATKIKTQTKQQILKQPHAADLNNKVKDMRSELKQLKEALSDYLREYQRISGVNEIEGNDGEIREIVYVAKLIKKFNKQR